MASFTLNINARANKSSKCTWQSEVLNFTGPYAESFLGRVHATQQYQISYHAPLYIKERSLEVFHFQIARLYYETALIKLTNGFIIYYSSIYIFWYLISKFISLAVIAQYLT